MRLISAVLGLPVALAALTFAPPAGATTLFWEDFNGYSRFRDREPWWDPVNKGLPEISEGADKLWFAGRFEKPHSYCEDGTLNCDLAVQRFGSFKNLSPVGRFEDDAGLMFSIDTTGFANVSLSFDWRTFSAHSGDQLVAGFLEGDIPLAVFGSDRTADFQTGPYAWASWTELLRQNAHNSFTHHEFALPSNVGTIWIALWLDNGEGDYGKIDNVHVNAEEIQVPEPATFLLGAGGLAAFALLGRRR